MNIGFDVSQTGSAKAGCGFFADGLIRQLARDDRDNDYLLYPAAGDIFWDPKFQESTYHCNQANFRRWSGPTTFDSSREFWRNPGPEFERKIGSPDIFHSNNFFCPTGLRSAKLVYTLYDLSFMEHPEWTTEANRTGCMRGVFQASLRADCIIAISEYSRDHFLTTFPHFPKERTAIVYPASRFFSGETGLRPDRFSMLKPGGFWLTVGTIEPRKNHSRLLDAMRILKSQAAPNFPLVIAGGKGWLMEDFHSHLRGLEPQKEVISTGYISDAELQWLYENCAAFVYPSLFEGFGMPVLEAMGFGATVLCSNVSSLPEVGGDAALYFDPRRPEEIAGLMARLLKGDFDESRMKAQSIEQSKKFSWYSSARRLREIYTQTLASRRPGEPALFASATS